MRVYISGAITNTPGYEENFERAKNNLLKIGYEVINPAKVENISTHKMEYEEYMKIDILLLGLCDAIYMLEGWQDSKGANREYGYALGSGMKVLFEGETVLG